VLPPHYARARTAAGIGVILAEAFS